MTGAIAITGATGFLGKRFCRVFAERGWEVRALARDPAGIAGGFLCDLPEHVDPEGLEGADVLLHCAYATRAKRLAEAKRVNEEGTRRLLAAAHAAGVGRTVFLSTTSAHADSESYYGRSKLALEGRFDLALRSGLVLASEGGGLFERLRDTVKRSRFIPVFGGGRQVVQTVHVDDLCAVLLKAIETERTGVLTVAEEKSTTYRELLTAIGDRLGRRPTLVPVPFGPALFALRAFEALRVTLPVTAENLLGLRSLRYSPPGPDLESLEVRIRSTAESLDKLLAAEDARES